MIKQIIAAVFRIPLVHTRDSDKEVRLRFVRHTPFDKNLIYGIAADIAQLSPNGKILGSGYMEDWKAANKYAERLFQ